MRSSIAVVVATALLSAAATFPALAGALDPAYATYDPAPEGTPAQIGTGGNCTDDIFCSTFPLHPDVFWWGDGEWNPATGEIGWIAVGPGNPGLIGFTGEICEQRTSCSVTWSDPNGEVGRGFAWGTGAGDMWVGSWEIPPFVGGLIHLDANCNEIAKYTYPDPLGGNMQFAGLGMDFANGHLWAVLRAPAPGPTRILELDVNQTPPAILQGPFDVPWSDGPDSNGRAGLEYNSSDCTIVVLRQDTSNTGSSLLAVFEDLNPAGAGGIALAGECTISSNGAHCTGPGQSTNHPWGLAVVESPQFGAYGIFSDINLDAACAIPPAGGESDLHIIALPTYTAACQVTALEPTTWGRIKERFTR